MAMFILRSLEENGQLTQGQWRRYRALEGTSVSEAMRDSAIAMREGTSIWICQVSFVASPKCLCP